MNGAASSYASLDNTVLHNGNPSIRVGPDYVRGTREVDGAWLNVKPGDHIVMQVWVKTAPYTSIDPQAGASFGFDLLTNQSSIDSLIHIVCLNGPPISMQAGHPTGNELNYAGGPNAFGHTINGESGLSQVGGLVCRVPYGQDWTLIQWDFIVPSTFYTWVTDNANYPNAIPCNPVQINMMVPWFTGRNLTDNAYMWFSEPSLYINPSTSTYNLIVQAATGGTTSPTPGTYTEPANANIVITQNTAAGNTFQYWIVDGVNSGITASSISILMNGNHTVQPYFTANQPPPGGTVGNTTIGTYSDQNDANAQSVSYFTPNFTGQINQIIAYIYGSTPGNCIAAAYAVSNGAAAALLEQSSPVAIGTSPSWVTFSLPTPINVTSGVPIGLALMANVQLNVSIVVGTGQRDHNGVSSYNAGFANPYGAIWGSDNTGAMSIYATSTTPITPTQTYIVNWAITPTAGSLPFTITFSGYLSRSSTPETGTIVNGETIQLQALAPGGSTWTNVTGVTAKTKSGTLGNGYFSGTWQLSLPGVYPGAWQFKSYYAGNTTKNLFGCDNRKKNLRKVNALIL